jgi:hypothetical protein
MYFNACSAHYQYTYQLLRICPHQRQFHPVFNSGIIFKYLNKYLVFGFHLRLNPTIVLDAEVPAQ